MIQKETEVEAFQALRFALEYLTILQDYYEEDRIRSAGKLFTWLYNGLGCGLSNNLPYPDRLEKARAMLAGVVEKMSKEDLRFAPEEEREALADLRALVADLLEWAERAKSQPGHVIEKARAVLAKYENEPS
jgi:hypothetical protein